ncbi:hypothetical protein MASR2M18_01560 [Ignavibacteria bacterium]|nr:flavodoxin reductase [Bacteroidota bacterium]MCZ2132773.1 flavodoxin reductase [Bacteroidota bacterium]
MEKIVKIKELENVTHDVLRIATEKPAGLTYSPGQAVDIAINNPDWKKEIRTFTFTSLPDDDYVEFTIKTYTSHNGVTNQLRSLKVGDELALYDVYGSIAYKGEGIFLAGGAGITPFLAILRSLEKQGKTGGNKLIFANRTKADIIRENTFKKMLGNNFINVLSDEKSPGYEYGYISAELIKKHIDEHTKYFYVCGPDPMMVAMEKHLSNLGISFDFIVKEAF